MPDITITIGSPIITAPAKFKTRYRELPSGSFTSNVDRTNAPFTLTGLTAGEYELEAIYVNPDGVECDTIIRTFTVVGDYNCISFTSEIIQDGSLYYLVINFTPPSQLSPVGTDPLCGWEVVYTQNGTTTTVPYATLPSSGEIKIPVANNSIILTIRAMMCAGKYKNCHVADVTPITPNPCIAISNVAYVIREVFNSALGKCEYFLDVSFTQSTPVTNPVFLVYSQGGTIFNNDFFSGQITVPSGTNVIFTKKLNPVLFDGQECTQYDISLVDVCGNGWPQNVPYCRTICFHATP